MSLIYVDTKRSSIPWAVFTGDALFVGDIGRLDFIGAGTYEQMYESLFQKLLGLENHVEIYPAHYAGSDCGSGAKMSFKTMSTIGYERRTNYILQAKTLDDFVARAS